MLLQAIEHAVDRCLAASANHGKNPIVSISGTPTNNTSCSSLEEIDNLLKTCAALYTIDKRGSRTYVSVLYFVDKYTFIHIFPLNPNDEYSQRARFTVGFGPTQIQGTVEACAKHDDIERYFTTTQELFKLLVEFGAVHSIDPWYCVKEACEKCNTTDPSLDLSISYNPLAYVSTSWKYAIKNGNTELACLQVKSKTSIHITPMEEGLTDHIIQDTGNGPWNVQHIQSILIVILSETA
jgi:hypothetical protein